MDEVTTRLAIQVEMTDLSYTTSAEISFMGNGFRRTFYGKIASIKARVVLRYNKARNTVSVLTVKVLPPMKGFTLRAKGGFRIADAITNQVIKAASGFLESTFRFAAEFALKKLFHEAATDNSMLKDVMD